MRRGRKAKRKALNRPKKKVANRILLGLHFVFACRKKKKKERKKEKKRERTQGRWSYHIHTPPLG